jgi:hypothetical protein
MNTEMTKKIFIDKKYLPGRMSDYRKNLTNFKVYEVVDIEGQGEWVWLIDDIGEGITVSSKYFYPIDVIRNKQLDEILK